jgi:DNA-binding NtrC family response regulator
MNIVLVVDDEPASAEETAEALADAGLAARWTNDPGEALVRAADPRIGLVVTDLRMPVVDGCGLIRKLGELRPDLRFIVISGNSADEAPEGVAVLRRFTKPFDIGELVAAAIDAVSAPASR